jgi:hypothetical protein
MAITSMILGIIGLVTGCIGIGIFLGIAGLILGIVALTQIGKPGQPSQGNGFAITGIITGGITVLMIPVLIGIMLPALGAARRTAQQTQANTQCRGIHHGAVTYSHSNNGQLPDDIAALLRGNYFTVQYAIAPQAPISVPSDFERWPDHQKSAWVRQNASFILVPGLRRDNNPNTIAIFGRPDHFPGKGIPVAYNDGHANWEIDVPAIERKLQQQTGKSLQQLINRQVQFTPAQNTAQPQPSQPQIQQPQPQPAHAQPLPPSGQNQAQRPQPPVQHLQEQAQRDMDNQLTAQARQDLQKNPPTAAEAQEQFNQINAAWQPAHGTPQNILPTMKGNRLDLADGSTLLRQRERLTTDVSYRPPVTFRIIALTELNDTRLAYPVEQVIFNWEMRPTELRVDGSPLSGRHKPGAGLLPPKQWVGIEMTVNPNEIIIHVNGQETYRQQADFSQVNRPFAITAHSRGDLRLKSIEVVQ